MKNFICVKHFIGLIIKSEVALDIIPEDLKHKKNRKCFKFLSKRILFKKMALCMAKVNFLKSKESFTTFP